MHWRVRPHDREVVHRICELTGVSPVIAQVLAVRDVTHPREIQSFLDTKLTHLLPPRDLPGVPLAVDVLYQAISARKRICIYGDYDCDGITATAILYLTLRALKADVSYFVPDRLDDGYGLNAQQVKALKDKGTDLMVTVDCGIGSTHEAELARQLGMQLIITDHHQLPAVLPTADAIVHPRLPDYSYPFPHLCGAGVAFKLAWALCQHATGSEKLPEPLRKLLFQLIVFAAIGTVADVVPLLGENRILVHHGLKLFKSFGGVGLEALSREARLGPKETYAAEDFAFTLAPRLNAAGRLGSARLAVELLECDDPHRCEMLAQYIHNLNKSRDSLERTITRQAKEQIAELYDLNDEPGLVLTAPGWHPGVIGIVAGRLAEEFQVPVVIISQDVKAGHPYVGSGRSARGIDLHGALTKASSWLVGYGGHPAAAGLKILPEQVDSFREAFCQAVRELEPDDQRRRELRIDVEAPLWLLDVSTIRQLEQLAPFGHENPRPVLCTLGASIVGEPKTMGSDGRHLAVEIQQDNTKLRAVAFGKAEWSQSLAAGSEHKYDFAFKPVINDFRGQQRVELHLIDFRPQQPI
ncbi:MAG TPA: single-stranded-DNA-specific exonuclease RecJ [Pirellulaceae bacterium]|nr:single-stranded-DNA-specific exonuclease RecJ [Pirellulaceae bacterium]